MYKVNGYKRERDQMEQILRDLGVDLLSFDVLEDDDDRFYIIKTTPFDPDSGEGYGIRYEVEQAFPQAAMLTYSRYAGLCSLFILQESY